MKLRPALGWQLIAAILIVLGALLAGAALIEREEAEVSLVGVGLTTAVGIGWRWAPARRWV